MTYASGELVAAQWRDNRWYRARVLESDVRKDVESSSVRVRLQRVHIPIPSLHDVIMLACVTWCVAGVFRRFWQHYLGDDHQPLALNSDHPRPLQQSYQGDSFQFELPINPLENLAKQHQCTPFVAMLALWHALLYRYSNQQQIRVGMPISGRDNPQLANVVGLLANTFAIESFIDDCY